MRHFKIILALFSLVTARVDAAAFDSAVVNIDQAYVEVHTGPGAGYPVFTVAERGQRLLVMAAKGDWYKVRTEHSEIGWVPGPSIADDFISYSPKMNFAEEERWRNTKRDFSLGFNSGMFGRDLMFGLSGAYHILQALRIEVSYAESSGAYAMSSYVSGGVQWILLPSARFSPGIFVAGGQVRGGAHATLLPMQSERVAFGAAGMTLRARITDRFYLRGGLGFYALQQAQEALPNYWEWQAGAETYF